MILNRNNIYNFDQEEIAYQLGLVVPPEKRYLFKKVREEDKPIAGYGTQIQNDEYSINNFFSNNNISLKQEYYYILDVEKARTFLKNNINNDIMICLHCGILYDSLESDWGHMVLFETINKDIVTILDPSEKRGIENVNINKLILSIRVHGKIKAAGFWLIKK
ncbi:MAG TPA: hypothetical protein PLC53_01855 [Bacilli bacterium]|nr:hypothetical protein [Bacilli bacterium]